MLGVVPVLVRAGRVWPLFHHKYLFDTGVRASLPGGTAADCAGADLLIQNLGVEIQRAVNKHRFMAIVYSVMAVGNVIISIPLAMCMGPVGSALGTAISLVLVNGLAMNIYYRKRLGWIFRLSGRVFFP